MGCEEIALLKDVLLPLAHPATKKEAQCLVDLFGFWRCHIPHLGMLLYLFIKCYGLCLHVPSKLHIVIAGWI